MKKTEKFIVFIATLGLTAVICFTHFENDVLFLFLFIVGLIIVSFIVVLNLYLTSKKYNWLLIIVISLWASILYGTHLQKLLVDFKKRKAKPAIEYLNNYKNEYGNYPESIDEDLFDSDIEYYIGTNRQHYHLVLPLNHSKRIVYDGIGRWEKEEIK